MRPNVLGLINFLLLGYFGAISSASRWIHYAQTKPRVRHESAFTTCCSKLGSVRAAAANGRGNLWGYWAEWRSEIASEEETDILALRRQPRDAPKHRELAAKFKSQRVSYTRPKKRPQRPRCWIREDWPTTPQVRRWWYDQVIPLVCSQLFKFLVVVTGLQVTRRGILGTALIGLCKNF